MRRVWSIVIAATLLAGCAGGNANSQAGGATAGDPDFRSFSGTIVSLRFTTSTMLISKEERIDQVRVPNNISAAMPMGRTWCSETPTSIRPPFISIAGVI
jgi:hypothetical protein